MIDIVTNHGDIKEFATILKSWNLVDAILSEPTFSALPVKSQRAIGESTQGFSEGTTCVQSSTKFLELHTASIIEISRIISEIVRLELMLAFKRLEDTTLNQTDQLQNIKIVTGILANRRLLSIWFPEEDILRHDLLNEVYSLSLLSEYVSPGYEVMLSRVNLTRGLLSMYSNDFWDGSALGDFSPGELLAFVGYEGEVPDFDNWDQLSPEQKRFILHFIYTLFENYKNIKKGDSSFDFRYVALDNGRRMLVAMNDAGVIDKEVFRGLGKKVTTTNGNGHGKGVLSLTRMANEVGTELYVFNDVYTNQMDWKPLRQNSLDTENFEILTSEVGKVYEADRSRVVAYVAIIR